MREALRAKRKPIITAEHVNATFDDECLLHLAKLGKLPKDANLARFARSIRTAATFFSSAARRLDTHGLYHEIDSLYRIARQGAVLDLQDALARLSPEARQLLAERRRTVGFIQSAWPDNWLATNRGNYPAELASTEMVSSSAQRDELCHEIMRLCQVGARFSETRNRPSGRKSRSWQPFLCVPQPAGRPAKRAAELLFVRLIALAWLESTGKLPSLSARHRTSGPFVRLVDECLRLVGAAYADPVALINRLSARGRP